MTQGIELDPNRDAIGKIHNAAKAAVLKRKANVAKELNLLGAALSGGTAASSSIGVPHGDAVGKADDDGAGDHDSDKENDSSEDEPLDAPNTGFTSMIKAFVPAEKSSNRGQAAPKAAAKTAAAKASVVKTRPSPKTAPVRTPSAKVAIGGADARGAKRRKSVADDVATPFDHDLSGDLQNQDRELVNEFKERFVGLRKLDPPVADGPFKSYLTDVCSQVTTLKGELKTKRRSALRRADKENDPLYIHLGELQVEADEYVHLLKCSLVSNTNLAIDSKMII